MNALEFRSIKHTPQFTEFVELLTVLELKNKVIKGKDVIDKVYGKVTYDPKDPADIYMVTKWMRDDELDFINELRKESGYKSLPRFAVLNGEYIPVANQTERREVESKNKEGFERFQDFIKNIDKTISKGIIHINARSEYDDRGPIDPLAEAYLDKVDL